MHDVLLTLIIIKKWGKVAECGELLVILSRNSNLYTYV